MNPVQGEGDDKETEDLKLPHVNMILHLTSMTTVNKH